MSSSRSKRPRSSKRIRLAAVAVAATSAGVTSPTMAQVGASWVTAAGGSWTEAARWSTNPDVPNNGTPAGTTYTATIDAAGAPFSVGLSSDVTVAGFTLNSGDATFAHSGGTFNAGAVSLLAGAYAAGGGALVATSVTGPAGIAVGGNFVLSPGTLATTVTAASGSNLTIGGAWTNSGAISVTGGTLTLAGTPTASLGSIALADSTLRVVTILTTGQLGGVSMVNSGTRLELGGGINNVGATIALGGGNPSLTLAGGNVSGGSITSTGGAKLLLAPGTVSGLGDVTLGASVDVPAATTLRLVRIAGNSGVIDVQNGGTVLIGGETVTGNLGTIRNVSGGRVIINQGALNNAGATLALNAETGPWTLGTSGWLFEGTLTTSGANHLVALGGLVDSVTVAGEIAVGDGATAAAMPVFSNVALAGPGGRVTVKAAPTGSNVGLLVRTLIQATPTLRGTGEVVFDGASDAGFVRAEKAGDSVTFAPGITVRTGTRGGVVGGGGTNVRNDGVLSAQTAGRTLSVQGTLGNVGTVEARNGSTLAVVNGTSNLSGGTLTGGTWAVYDTATLALPAGATITTNAANVTLSGAGSTFAAMDEVASNSGTLTIAGGKRFTTAGDLANSGTIRVGDASTLKVAGTLNNTGLVDLAGGTLVLDYSGSSPAEALRAQLAAGRAGGSWAGATGVTSSTAAGDAQLRVGVGYAEASELGVTAWAGVDVDSTAVVTKLTYYGDANLDGRVDRDDFALVDRGMARGLGGWVNGDFDYSGGVTSADYLLMDRVYVQQGGVLSPALLSEREAQFGAGYAAQLIAAVPEPSAVLFIASAGVPLVMRRRRA